MVNPTKDVLAAELRELGRRLDVPEPPDLSSAVLDRLAASPPARRRRFAVNWLPPRRWWVAVASAVLVCALVAISPARAAVADAVTGLLRFAGIEIRSERGPAALPTPSPMPSVRQVGLDEARRLAKFPVRIPGKLGEPERVTLSDPAPDGAPRVVSLSYRAGAVRLDEFDGGLEPVFLKQAPGVDWVDFGGYPAVWLPAPHAVTYVDRTGVEHVESARLAGPTLIWTDGTASYRLEGVPNRDEAVRIAASLSP